MRYLTDRKRAQGLGSAKSGTEHFWHMQISSAALVILVPLFVFTFGGIIGAPYEEVVAYFSRPLPALITMLALVVGIFHLMNEAITAVEDYVHGLAGKLTIIAVTALSYCVMAAGVFALARMAL